MYQGSSALNYASQKQIITPKFKFELTPGRYKESAGQTRGITLGLGGSRGFAWLSNGIFYNDRIILSGMTGFNQGLSGGLGIIRSYPASLGESPVSTTLRERTQQSNFVVNGNTLYFFYMTHSRDGVTFFTRFYRRTSSDGVSFGGETLIFVGDAGNDQMDFSAVSPTEFYYYNGASSYQNADQRIFYINISTGITRDLLMDALPSGQNINGFHALRKENYDNIYIFTAPPNPDTHNAIYGDDACLVRVTTDTYNIFNREVLARDYLDGLEAITNVSAGASYDYLGIFLDRVYFVNDEGITQSYQYDNTVSVIKVGKEDISFVEVVPQAGSNDGVFNFAIVAGSTNMIGSSSFEYLFVSGHQSDQYFTYNGNSAVDISDNIISYTNTNNDRITITLGNMK